MNRYIFFLPSLFFLSILGCGGGSDKPVAEFNNSPITEAQYLKRLETLPNVYVVIRGQRVLAPVAEPLSAQALRSLMQEETLLQVAKDQGVMPTQADVDKEIQFNEQLQSNWLNNLKEQGFTLDDIRRLVLVELARERLVTRGVPEKTLADVDKYVKENPEQFIQPATVKFRWIVVEKGMEKKVDDALGKGLTFGAVASEFSIVPDAKLSNGSFPATSQEPRPVPIDRLSPPLRKAAESTPERKISGWFDYQGKRAKIYVESKTPAQKMTLTSAMKEKIKRQLMIQDGIGNELDRLLLQKIIEAEIKVFPPYLRRTWESYREQLKDAATEMLGSAPEKKADEVGTTPSTKAK
ncbi:MAG TPA: SurA N-terminal domain-containing protein [Fimbriimonadales bacterium]|nr:SurA N-terminal domain-containing protein [Fimbriimonadales bacterium]